MKKEKKLFDILKLIAVPLVFAAIIFLICYCLMVFLFNNNTYVSFFAFFIQNDGTDNDTVNITDIFKGNLVQTETSIDNTVDENDIRFPKYGMRYAQIESEKAKESIPLYFGDGTDILKLGAGQYIGSSLPGYGRPILIGGHNNSYFAFLQYLKRGETITIRTNYGEYVYKVTETFVASKDAKWVYDADHNGEKLVLYTCYPFSALFLTDERYFVYADKVSGPIVVSNT